MLVKDVIKLASDFTENETLSAKIEKGTELSDDENQVANELEKCFNLVNNEIASEFVPIKKIEQVEVSNGKILFSAFSSKPFKILYVKNSLGRKIKYKVFSDYIFALCKKAIVCYSTLPENLTINDEFETFLPERIYAYGVAREYYFLKTKFDDADIWEERFKNSLEILCRKSSCHRLPRRRWL